MPGERVDLFHTAVQGAMTHLLDTDSPADPSPPRFLGEYLVLQAALPQTPIQNIGVLLPDLTSTRLYCRFRKDFTEFAGEEADWFEQLPADISEQAVLLGPEPCIEWIESTFSNTVRVSPRKPVLIDTYAQTLNALYSRHIRSTILRFRTHLPQYSLEAAAGKFGRQMIVEPEGWVEIRADTPLAEDMFVIHVKGHSMEPLIPDASLCAFRSTIEGSWNDKILLLAQQGLNRFTIKRCRCRDASVTLQLYGDVWLHPPLTLESLNPAYPPWEIPTTDGIRALGEFLFVL